MVSLKKITDQSWLVLTDDGGNRVGLLSENAGKFTLLAKEGAKTSFDSKDEIKEFFNQDVFENYTVVESTEKDFYVNGYPVDYNDPIEIDDCEYDLPLYVKSEKSNVKYAAGYYVAFFPKNPVWGWCPKLETLLKYGYDGPYKSEFEVKQALSIAKKQKRNKQQ